MTPVQEFKWNEYVHNHPSCNKPALRAIFLAGWNAANGITEEDAKKIEEWNKRQLTLDL